jgi:hypothetical protein
LQVEQIMDKISMVKRREELKVAPKVGLSGIGLPSFLQFIEMEKKTCTLNVKSQGKQGSLYFIKGVLQDAETDLLKGDDAAYEVMCWDDSEIEIDVYKKRSKRIKSTVGQTLMHIFRIKVGKEKELNDQKILRESFRRQEEESNEPSSEDDCLEIIETKNNTKIETKEKHLNASKLSKAIETMKENLGGGLLGSDIWGTTDMISVAGFNPNPSACAVFGQIIASTNKSLKASKFPIIGRYFLIDLTEGQLFLIIPMGDYIWGNLIDGKKTPLGLLLNIALPQAIAAFEEAITS